MKLTTKMRYGTRAMLELALHYEQGPISLKEIAERQCVSAKYLEQLFVALQSAGLVVSIRGAHGGYILSRAPNQITLRELYIVLEGGDSFVDFTANPQLCARTEICVTQEVWTQMCEASMAVLESTTLADLADRANQKRESPLMYYI